MDFGVLKIGNDVVVGIGTMRTHLSFCRHAFPDETGRTCLILCIAKLRIYKVWIR